MVHLAWLRGEKIVKAPQVNKMTKRFIIGPHCRNGSSAPLLRRCCNDALVRPVNFFGNFLLRLFVRYL